MRQGYILGTTKIYPGVESGNYHLCRGRLPRIYPGILWEGGRFPDLTPGPATIMVFSFAPKPKRLMAVGLCILIDLKSENC